MTEEWMKDNGITDDDLIPIYQSPDGDDDDNTKDNYYFELLWNNYPSESIQHINSANGKDFFKDHCAIDLSEALIKSGVKLNGFKGVRCYGKCPRGRGSHAIRAQELATYLKNTKKLPFILLTGKNYEEYVKDKTGIIFFKDYWQRPGEKGNIRTGDHIDLWNKNELASIGLVFTFIRRYMPETSENYLNMSDLRRSTQVLFFEIK